jgi:hypothetical protein
MLKIPIPHKNPTTPITIRICFIERLIYTPPLNPKKHREQGAHPSSPLTPGPIDDYTQSRLAVGSRNRAVSQPPARYSASFHLRSCLCISCSLPPVGLLLPVAASTPPPPRSGPHGEEPGLRRLHRSDPRPLPTASTSESRGTAGPFMRIGFPPIFPGVGVRIEGKFVIICSV